MFARVFGMNIFRTGTINLILKALILSLRPRWPYGYCNARLCITHSNNRTTIMYGIEINLTRVDEVAIRYTFSERVTM